MRHVVRAVLYAVASLTAIAVLVPGCTFDASGPGPGDIGEGPTCIRLALQYSPFDEPDDITFDPGFPPSPSELIAQCEDAADALGLEWQLQHLPPGEDPESLGASSEVSIFRFEEGPPFRCFAEAGVGNGKLLELVDLDDLDDTYGTWRVIHRVAGWEVTCDGIDVMGCPNPLNPTPDIWVSHATRDVDTCVQELREVPEEGVLIDDVPFP